MELEERTAGDGAVRGGGSPSRKRTMPIVIFLSSTQLSDTSFGPISRNDTNYELVPVYRNRYSRYSSKFRSRENVEAKVV